MLSIIQKHLKSLEAIKDQGEELKATFADLGVTLDDVDFLEEQTNRGLCETHFSFFTCRAGENKLEMTFHLGVEKPEDGEVRIKAKTIPAVVFMSDFSMMDRKAMEVMARYLRGQYDREISAFLRDMKEAGFSLHHI